MQAAKQWAAGGKSMQWGAYTGYYYCLIARLFLVPFTGAELIWYVEYNEDMQHCTVPSQLMQFSCRQQDCSA